MDSTSSCDRSYRSAILHILLYSEGMKVTPKCEEFTSFFTYYFPDLTDMVQFLVSKGANVNARDQSLFTVLHMASESGNFSLENKKKVMVSLIKLYNYFLGHAEQVSFLVENGANLESKDAIEFTPLHRATFSRS